jgi:hypothetical protein
MYDQVSGVFTSRRREADRHFQICEHEAKTRSAVTERMRINSNVLSLVYARFDLACAAENVNRTLPSPRIPYAHGQEGGHQDAAGAKELEVQRSRTHPAAVAFGEQPELEGDRGW